MVKLHFMLELNRLVLARVVVFPRLSQWATPLSTAVVKPTWWPLDSPEELLLRLSRKGSSIKMEKFLIDSTSRENSWEKEDSQSAMSLSSARPKPSLLPRSFKSPLSRGAEPSRSSWVRLRFIDPWNMPTWLNLCIFSRTATMSTFCWSFAITRAWTSFWKEEKGSMSLRWSVILCKLSTLLNTCIRTESSIEI